MKRADELGDRLTLVANRDLLAQDGPLIVRIAGIDRSGVWISAVSQLEIAIRLSYRIAGRDCDAWCESR